MSVTTTYASTVTTVETLETNVPAASAGDKTVTHNGFNSSAALNAGSTPPATKCAYFTQALTAGAATIDLTALTGTNGATVNGTGLKLQVLKIKNLGANTLTITTGASNGYAVAGADFSVALAQNQEFTFYGNDATPEIASDAKTIDLAGTSAQTSQVTIVMG
jgi:hypothetical protein